MTRTGAVELGGRSRSGLGRCTSAGRSGMLLANVHCSDGARSSHQSRSACVLIAWLLRSASTRGPRAGPADHFWPGPEGRTSTRTSEASTERWTSTGASRNAAPGSGAANRGEAAARCTACASRPSTSSISACTRAVAFCSCGPVMALGVVALEALESGQQDVALPAVGLDQRARPRRPGSPPRAATTRGSLTICGDDRPHVLCRSWSPR